MNIQAYITALNLLKKQAESRFAKNMGGIERDVLDGTYQWLIDNLEIVQGSIGVNEDLPGIMDNFIQATVNAINSSTKFEGTIGKFLGDLAGISENAKKFHKTTHNFDIEKAGVNDVQKAVINDIIDQYTGNGLNAHFAQPLKENIFRNILAGADMKDVRKVLEDYILSGQDKSGKLKSYLDQTAMQAVDTYTGVLNQQMMKSFKYTGLIISGSLIETSSKQCVLAVEESDGDYGYLDNEEWEKILEVARNNPKARLIKGTTLENLPINKLHWGCRHDFTPAIISKPAQGPEKEQPKDQPAPAPAPKKQPKKAPEAPAVKKGEYVEAKTKAKAKENLKDILETNTGFTFEKVKVSSKLDLAVMNKMNKMLAELSTNYNNSDQWDKTRPANLSYSSSKSSYGFIKHGTVRNTTGSAVPDRRYLAEANFGSTSDPLRHVDYPVGTVLIGQSKSKVDKDNSDVATVVHEYGHFIATSSGKDHDPSFWISLRDYRKEYSEELAKLNRDGDQEKVKEIFLGRYASTNIDEFLAEGFTEYKLSSNPGPYATKIGKLIDKYFKK